MWSDGPVVLGIPWLASAMLVRNGADLARRLNVHLACAFVDPESYLTEWGPPDSRTGVSLDPAPKRESDFFPAAMLDWLRILLGPPGQDWTFRVPCTASPRAQTRRCSWLVARGQAGWPEWHASWRGTHQHVPYPLAVQAGCSRAAR